MDLSRLQSWICWRSWRWFLFWICSVVFGSASKQPNRKSVDIVLKRRHDCTKCIGQRWQYLFSRRDHSRMFARFPRFHVLVEKWTKKMQSPYSACSSVRPHLHKCFFNHALSITKIPALFLTSQQRIDIIVLEVIRHPSAIAAHLIHLAFKSVPCHIISMWPSAGLTNKQLWIFITPLFQPKRSPVSIFITQPHGLNMCRLESDIIGLVN